MILTRRNFFGLLAAPAIVKAASLMPVKAPPLVLPSLDIAPTWAVQGIAYDSVSNAFWIAGHDALTHLTMVDGVPTVKQVIRIGEAWVPARVLA